MELENLKKPLDIKDIDFRIQSINKGGYATILAYKDARVDMNRLDEIVGAGFWKREHFDNNTRCKVSIYNKEIEEWVSKEDVGTASNTEKEKGLASDSFKRACFNWGIGRELYDFPNMSIKLNNNEYYDQGGKMKQSFDLRLNDWKWEAKYETGVLISLIATDNHGEVRFEFENGKIKNTSNNNFNNADSNKENEVEKEWYNNFDKHIEFYKKQIKEGKTAKELIAKLCEKYKVNKKVRESIEDLETDNK